MEFRGWQKTATTKHLGCPRAPPFAKGGRGGFAFASFLRSSVGTQSLGRSGVCLRDAPPKGAAHLAGLNPLCPPFAKVLQEIPGETPFEASPSPSRKGRGTRGACSPEFPDEPLQRGELGANGHCSERSSISRTLRKSSTGCTGFMMSWIPCSLTPRRSMKSEV